MSFPMKGQTYGNLYYQNREYRVLKTPTDSKIFETIIEYKKSLDDVIYSTAPRGANAFSWSIEDNKLYLTEINFFQINRKNTDKRYRAISTAKNYIQEIFTCDKLFLSDFSGDIELLVSKEDTKIINADTSPIAFVKMKKIELSFQNGVLSDVKHTVEEFQTRRLKNYIID